MGSYCHRYYKEHVRFKQVQKYQNAWHARQTKGEYISETVKEHYRVRKLAADAAKLKPNWNDCSSLMSCGMKEWS